MVVAVAEAERAPRLVDIVAGHIDGCLYHGQAGLDFALALAEGGGEVAVPTTLNVASLDLLHPDLYRGDPETAARARRLMDAYVDLGCRSTWTCAPYQLPERPKKGAQIAWGESSAIVFANSVLGARTNRYGDFLDICCALIGRAPLTGLHTDQGRWATVVVELDVPDSLLDSDLLYPTLGHVIGEIAGNSVSAILGLDHRADADRLKGLGASAASSGSVGMFHAVGVTPEAPDLTTALGGTEDPARLTVDLDRLERARRCLSGTRGPVAAVSVGTPHMSLAEIAQLAEMAKGRRSTMPFYVNTSRHVLAAIEENSHAKTLRRFGATFVTDTCTYVTPIIGEVDGAVMTNSGKWAFYAPANLGVEVVFASLGDCVETAVSGETVQERW
jgi:predicted aconitase